MTKKITRGLLPGTLICSNGLVLTVRIEVANISPILIGKAANSDSKSSLCVIASKR